MANMRKPRSGSMQFWHRKRASRIYPGINNWNLHKQNKLLCFAGYKVGMTHIIYNDVSNATTKGMKVVCPVTVIECPPLKTYSLRFYKHTEKGYHVIGELKNKKLEKELGRKIVLPKKLKEDKVPEFFDEIRLAVYTQPKLTSIGKKKPELFEIGLASKDLEFAKQFLDKDIKIGMVFKEGQYVDVHAVTKGKGIEGPVKRFGIRIRQHKSEKTKRGPGSLGGWSGQGQTMWRIAHAGQMGFHTRTDYNKGLLKMGSNVTEINPKGGFLHYGDVKNDYILIKGSVSGSIKRLIMITEPVRIKKLPSQNLDITHVSLESKQ